MQLGCYPVAVVVTCNKTNIYIYIYMELVTDKSSFKPGGLHEKHVVATWKHRSHLSICWETKNTVSRWPVAGPSEY
jgi:hypothetical protein